MKSLFSATVLVLLVASAYSLPQRNPGEFSDNKSFLERMLNVLAGEKANEEVFKKLCKHACIGLF